MEYFGIDEKVLYPSNSFLNDSVTYEQKPKRNFGKLRDFGNKDKKDKGKKDKDKEKGKDEEKPVNQLRRNLSKKRVERPTTTVIRKEVNAMWNEALKEERNYIREHSPDRVSRITTLSNVQGFGAKTNRYQEPQSFGKRTNMNLDFSIPMPYEKKKGTLFRNSNGNRRKIFSKTWWKNVPIGAYLFFFGFLLFPLWFVGAFCKFRKDNTVEAEIQRTKSKKVVNKDTKSDGDRDWKSKVDKNKTNNGNINESHVEFSKVDDPENSESWNWGLGGVGNQPETINVNFMSGIEEFEKHKLAENEKWWRKVNMLMSVLVTIFIVGLLVIKRKQIFGGGNDVSSAGNYNKSNSGFSNNSNDPTGTINSKPTSSQIPLNNFGNQRDGNGGEIAD
ncbi:hypothetical protein BCR32DRAFT_265535 [Anaeromyces robustus]|uniref:Uncharacterized protein n=1 Tax=Anaeromyces robustus TaxID=1754192 RepID=A0A1Y1XIQ9_9FUNG|nr:hypothetical protein BCR32DRAFT_265535 [Anaeromyces robustus]|eukprot:ORX85582.1 hypothetical protein BCR32DRAFT_265535 [Anaeromyces robustus]